MRLETMRHWYPRFAMNSEVGLCTVCDGVHPIKGYLMKSRTGRWDRHKRLCTGCMKDWVEANREWLVMLELMK